MMELITRVVGAMRAAIRSIRQARCKHGPWDHTTMFGRDGSATMQECCRACGRTNTYRRAPLRVK